MREPLAEPDEAQRFVGGHRIVGHLGDEFDVLARGQARDEVVELEHEAHMMTAVVRQRGVISGAEVEVAETHAAAGRPVEPAQYVEQRRLAGAGRSEQHQEFARVDVQVDAAQGVHRGGPLTIGPLEPPHLEDGRARGAHPSQTLALRNMRIQPESSPVAADAGVRAAGAGSGRQDSCALR